MLCPRRPEDEMMNHEFGVAIVKPNTRILGTLFGLSIVQNSMQARLMKRSLQPRVQCSCPQAPLMSSSTMNVLRHRSLRASVLTGPFRRTISSTPLRRFPDPAPTPETFSSKARPTSVHASPESSAGRSYIPPSTSTATSSAVREALKQGAVEESFAGPARPRLRYERPKEARPLPDDPSRWRYCTFSPASTFLPLSPLTILSPLLTELFRTRQTSPSLRSQSPYGPFSSFTSPTPKGCRPRSSVRSLSNCGTRTRSSGPLGMESGMRKTGGVSRLFPFLGGARFRLADETFPR